MTASPPTLSLPLYAAIPCLVLYPRAVKDPQVLQQEGWHLELEDAAQPLTYKGVVYNEMKGVYSSPEARLGRASQQVLATAVLP